MLSHTRLFSNQVFISAASQWNIGKGTYFGKNKYMYVRILVFYTDLDCKKIQFFKNVLRGDYGSFLSALSVACVLLDV